MALEFLRHDVPHRVSVRRRPGGDGPHHVPEERRGLDVLRDHRGRLKHHRVEGSVLNPQLVQVVENPCAPLERSLGGADQERLGVDETPRFSDRDSEVPVAWIEC